MAKQLHMPAQSGSSRMLEAMRRGHDRPAYDALVRRVRELVPQVSWHFFVFEWIWEAGSPARGSGVSLPRKHTLLCLVLMYPG